MKEIFEINLQLFAEPTLNTQTTANVGAIGYTPVSDLTAEMKTFYSKDLIEMLGANLVHLQFGDKVALPKHGGKTIEWRKWTKFAKALSPLEEGVTPSGTPISVGTVTARLNQYGDYTVVTDLLELGAIDNVILEVTAKHAENAKVTLDTITRNALLASEDGATIIWADKLQGGKRVETAGRSALDDTCVMTAEMVAKAAAALKRANAPKFDGSYVAIVHPSVAFDLMTEKDGWIDVNKYSNATAIFNGELGKLHGVRFVESTEAKVDQVEGVYGGKAIYTTIFLGKGAYKVVELDNKSVEIIVKPRGTAGFDPLDQRSSIGWKAVGFTAKVTIPEYIVAVESVSRLSSSDSAN